MSVSRHSPEASSAAAEDQETLNRQTPPDAPIEEVLKALAGLPESPDLREVEALVRELAEHAAVLDGLAREVVRERAFAVLTEKKIQAPARLLELAFKSLGPADGSADQSQGQRLHLADPEPWPHPVDGAALLEALEALFLRYVVLPVGGAVALALWTLFTYVHDAFFVSPLLALTSPEKRCGKTTVLHLLVATVRRALPTSNITPAALFRSVEKFRPTLLVDEADTFLAEREELQGILNSGHTRRTAFVVRTVGEDHEPRRFSTWAPKAVALIGRLPSTLEDRAVNIPMRRRAPEEKVQKLRLDSLEEVDEIGQRCLRWAADHLDALRQPDPEVPAELHDRAADNWRPLLAIADAAGGSWPASAREAAVSLSSGDQTEDASPRVELLRDIHEAVGSASVEAMYSKILIKKLCQDQGKPWGEWQNGKPLSPITLAKMLRPFGIRPRKIRVKTSTGQGYLLADFEDAFARYLPSDPEHPEQVNNDGGLRASESRNTRADVPGRESAETPVTTGVVPGVPGPKGVPIRIEDFIDTDREVMEL